ncbi:MAG TPA: hypothetical protein VKM55_09555 [Candidatus Lokiarchaeia archaeon]|nr:hypothetical protein [Candidatus Lokiarchaeia archaeon]
MLRVNNILAIFGENGTTIENKVPDLLELLKRPAIGQAATPEVIELDIEQMQKDQIELSERDEAILKD